mgnify:FL=1
MISFYFLSCFLIFYVNVPYANTTCKNKKNSSYSEKKERKFTNFATQTRFSGKEKQNMNHTQSIAIIGAGAAGCFCAINLKRFLPELDIDIFEASDTALRKLAMTGGGRCNLTNTFVEVEKLFKVYPRGDKLLNRAFSKFDSGDTMQWFEDAGISLYSQEDNRVFPTSDNAMEVVEMLLHKINILGIHLHLAHKVATIGFDNGKYSLVFQSQGQKSKQYDKIVVTTGSFTSDGTGNMLKAFDLKIVPPCGSLFSFSIDSEWCEKLMGASVENVSLRLAGTRFKTNGSILFTHWGVSGPAVLKLSSVAARYLFEKSYKATLLVNWFNEYSEDDIRQVLQEFIAEHPQKQVTNIYPDIFSQKQWTYFLEKAKIPFSQRWNALTSTHINRLIARLSNDEYTIKGKAHYKKEFVTCGGVALCNVNYDTLESTKQKGLYFAGEVLDIDALTGGFNLQAAWSTAYCVAKAIASE